MPAHSGIGDQWHGSWLTTTSWATFGIGWGNPESKHSLVDDTGCWQCFLTYDVARVLLCFDGTTGPLSCADSSACGWSEGVQVSSMDNEMFSCVKSKTLWEQFHQLMPGIYFAIPLNHILFIPEEARFCIWWSIAVSRSTGFANVLALHNLFDFNLEESLLL